MGWYRRPTGKLDKAERFRRGRSPKPKLPRMKVLHPIKTNKQGAMLLFCHLIEHPTLVEYLHICNVETSLQLKKVMEAANEKLTWDIMKMLVTDVLNGKVLLIHE